MIFGLARFDDLDAAKQKKHGAEGTVSDPALLQLLAQSYRLPWNLAPVPRNKDNMSTNNGGVNSNVTNASEIPLTPDCDSLVDLDLGSANVENSENQKTIQYSQNNTSNNNAVINIQTLRIRHRHARRFYREILRACQFNLLVAQRAGLHSRASVWSALLALLPRPEDSFSAHVQLLQLQQDPKGYGSRPSSNKNINMINSSTASPSQLHSYRGGISDNNSYHSVFRSLADAETLLQDMLRELLDAGDALHFVLVREILLRCQRAQAYAGLPSETSEQAAFQALSPVERLQERRVTQMYMAYADLLRRWTLPQCANDILKYVTDPVLIQRARADVTFKLSCALCSGTELRNREIRQRGSTAYCAKCKVSVSYCSVCCRPVTGLVQWCVICGHGGHFHCLQQWFRSCGSQASSSSSTGTAASPSAGSGSSSAGGAVAGMSSLVANTGGGGNHMIGSTTHVSVLTAATSGNMYSTTSVSAAVSSGTVTSMTQYTNSNNKTCPTGCGHRCAAPKVSHSPYLPDDMKRYCVPLPHKIPAGSHRTRRSRTSREAVGMSDQLNTQQVSGLGGLATSISSTNLAGQLSNQHAAPPSNMNSNNNLAQMDFAPSISTNSQQILQLQQQGYRAMTTLSAAEVRRNQLYRYMHSTYSPAVSTSHPTHNSITTVGH